MTDEDITLTYTNQTVDLNTFGIDQTIIAYAGLMSSKTELTLEGAETNQYASGDFSQKVLTGSFSLEKK